MYLKPALVAAVVFLMVLSPAWADPAAPKAGAPLFALAPDETGFPIETEGSFALVGRPGSGQIALAGPLRRAAMAVAAGEEVRVMAPLEGLDGPYAITVEAVLVGGGAAEVWAALESGPVSRIQLSGPRTRLTLTGDGARAADKLTIGATCAAGEAAVRWSNLQLKSGTATIPISLFPAPAPRPPFPALREVAMRPILENEIVEWDWRLQDGIGVDLMPASYETAIEKTLGRGDALLAWLRREAPEGAAAGAKAWETLRNELADLRVARTPANDTRWEDLWRRAHQARRTLALANPHAQTGPLVFVKYVPGAFSHQLTQNYGRYARPGGGVFVLERPGESMALRQLGVGALPQGSYMQPEVTSDGRSVLAAFCAVDTPPQDTRNGDPGRYYHLYEFAADGSSARQLTDGTHEDFSPKELPDGDVIFISTRRGGWHRCGGIGCPVYTLARMARDGSGIRTISYHETQEWDPAVLNDGRIIYTRWDYVDRNAVHYQQLWSVRPDGSAPAAYYGNNTLSPAGIWEARPVPGSQLAMATAAPHHGMSAGSIILVDVRKGVDGPAALTRLTPDVPFPETEAPLLPGWRAPFAPEPPMRTPEMDRWPGQCYKSPWPIAEDVFLAAYSYDALIGEPVGNPANMFGLYLVDAFGNRELLYRDLNISSAWPIPLRPRSKPPVVAPASSPASSHGGVAADSAPNEGTYFLQDVYESEPALERGSVKRLRIVQVLPKGTPVANTPRVGVAYASPGKQVLGTVPVETDGSAFFRVPAGIPLAFQALDDKGQAVQIMRSISYIQPGERASCTGCHEPRLSAPPSRTEKPLALKRAASVIEPGPDGSRPLSYPILVQPVLDRRCVGCHGGEKPAGPEGKPIVLTGAPEGEFTTSYNALAERVAYSAWNKGNKFPEGNGEPMSMPGVFGAKGSPLMKMLLAGHNKVELSPDDIDRLTTWMDANGLFYGTFDFEDQKKQQRGERIAGPSVE